MLYSLWRFQGKSPFEGFFGRPPRRGEPCHPSRQEAILEAFSLYSAERERDLRSTVDGLAEGMKKGRRS